MRFFYQEEEKKIIVAPFLNGSTYLMNSGISGLAFFDRTNEMQTENIKKILSEKNTKKIFLYRDPVERFFSFYNKFIFPTSSAATSSAVRFIKNKKDILILFPHTLNTNFWKSAKTMLPALEKNFNLNSHTATQYSFFEFFEQSPDDYNIYNAESFTKWLYLEFAITEIAAEHEFLNIAADKNILDIIEIIDTIKKIYKDDYEYLKPLAMDL